MTEKTGAMTVAEGSHKYKTDVELVLGNEKKVRTYVLRTTLDSLAVWKAKHVRVNMSPFESRIDSTTKDAAIIDGEAWVFGIDSTKVNDVVAAVKIAMNYFKIQADVFLSNVYVKNLNAENENEMGTQALITANKKLYKGVCEAIIEASKKLGVKGNIRLSVFSSNLNPKIPGKDLHDALKQGGAKDVVTDENVYKYFSGSNDGVARRLFKTNFHLAILKVK